MFWGRTPRSAGDGFTLVELIVVIAIIAILAAIALPNFGSSMRSGRVTTQANDLVSAFGMARSEAITRTRGISVCAADTSAGMPTACGTDWATGWALFIDDTPGTTAPTTFTAAKLLRTWKGTPRTQVTGDSFVRFSPRGESVAGDKVFTIVPTDACTGQQKRTIDISPMGRALSTRGDCP